MPQRDWVDYAGLLALPAAVFVFSLFTSLHDGHLEELKVQSGYADDLGDSNDAKQQIALLELEDLATHNKLDPRVLEMVKAIAKGGHVALTTVYAKDVIADEKNQSGSGAAVQSQALELSGATIYIQIADENQRPNANTLLSVLQAYGASAQGVEDVGDRAPTNTQVRWFSVGTEAIQANVNKILQSCGYVSTTQPMNTNYPKAGNEIEIWIGNTENNDGSKLASCRPNAQQ